MPQTPPTDGPIVLDIKKYGPPDSSSPFEANAESEHILIKTSKNDISSPIRVSFPPEVPTTYGKRAKHMIFTILTKHGQKTPINVPHLRAEPF